jgi:hypothetical protein
LKLKDKIRTVLREYYGGFETNLENSYEYWVTENLSNSDFKNRLKLATYNQVILELKHNIKDKLILSELQYRITEESEPKNVCIEAIKKVKYRTPELDRLYHKIKNF